MKKKFYKKSVKQKNEELPSNSRTIPEKLNTDGYIFLVGFTVVLVAISLISLDIYANFNKQKELTNEKFRILKEVSFWENEVITKPGYRDAYMKLAVLNFQMKNFTEARVNLEKALELDPNFEKGRELEKLLDNF